MTIDDLYDVCEQNKDSYVVAVINGKEINVSCYYYVEKSICFWCKGIKDDPYFAYAKGENILKSIEEEAKDSCWAGTSFRSSNCYNKCSIAYFNNSDILNLHNDIAYFNNSDILNIHNVNRDIYYIIDIIVKDNKIKFYM